MHQITPGGETSNQDLICANSLGTPTLKPNRLPRKGGWYKSLTHGSIHELYRPPEQQVICS